MNKLFKIAMVTVSILFLFLTGYIVFSIPASLPLPAPPLETFRLTVANINFENKQRNEISESLLNTESHLFILFEWTGKNLNLNMLKAQGFTVLLDKPRRGTHGVCVITKNPEGREAILLPSPTRGPCQIPFAAIRVKRKGEFVTILGVHAPPPVPACQKTTRSTLQSIISLIQRGKLNQPIGKSMKGESVILAGDFNVSPFDSVLKEFSSAGLKDAYAATTWRPGPTWTPHPVFPACVRIDYIWVPNEYAILNSYVIPLPGSDHQGVVVDSKW